MPPQVMKIQISDDDVQELQLRLKQTRWPPATEGSAWAAGTDAAYLRELVEYWASEYRWREREARLNRLSLHWFTRSGAASVRLYRDAALDPGAAGRVEAPTAILMPLRDGITVPAPRAWAERFYDVQRWTLMERGGHFPEWEAPEAVATDVRQFFAGLT